VVALGVVLTDVERHVGERSCQVGVAAQRRRPDDPRRPVDDLACRALDGRPDGRDRQAVVDSGVGCGVGCGVGWAAACCRARRSSTRRAARRRRSRVARRCGETVICTQVARG